MRRREEEERRKRNEEPVHSGLQFPHDLSELRVCARGVDDAGEGSGWGRTRACLMKDKGGQGKGGEGRREEEDDKGKEWDGKRKMTTGMVEEEEGEGEVG